MDFNKTLREMAVKERVQFDSRNANIKHVSQAYIISNYFWQAHPFAYVFWAYVFNQSSIMSSITSLLSCNILTDYCVHSLTFFSMHLFKNGISTACTADTLQQESV